MATHIRSSLVKSRSHAAPAASVTPVALAPAAPSAEVEAGPASDLAPASGTHIRKPPIPSRRPPAPVAATVRVEEPLELDVAPDPTEPPTPAPAAVLAPETVPLAAPAFTAPAAPGAELEAVAAMAAAEEETRASEPLLDATEVLMWSDLARARRAFLSRCVMGVVGACGLLCIVAVVRAGTATDAPVAMRDVTAELPRPTPPIADPVAVRPADPVEPPASAAQAPTEPNAATAGSPKASLARGRANAKGRRSAIDRP